MSAYTGKLGTKLSKLGAFMLGAIGFDRKKVALQVVFTPALRQVQPFAGVARVTFLPPTEQRIFSR